MSSDSGELPAVHSDEELPRATENPEINALDRTKPQETRPMPDDYTTADIHSLLHRLYALASQI